MLFKNCINISQGFVRVLLCVSCVPASCVHIWFVPCPCFMSLWVSMFQLCLCDYVLITLCILVVSFEFDFVWSTCDFPVYPVSLPCLVLPWLNTIIWVYVLGLRVLVPPLCVHRDKGTVFSCMIDQINATLVSVRDFFSFKNLTNHKLLNGSGEETNHRCCMLFTDTKLLMGTTWIHSLKFKKSVLQ